MFYTGPFPYPLVGNLIQMARASPVSNLSIAKFSETYGEIFRLKLGFKDIGKTSNFFIRKIVRIILM